jgi:hypothetical protein
VVEPVAVVAPTPIAQPVVEPVAVVAPTPIATPVSEPVVVAPTPIATPVSEPVVVAPTPISHPKGFLAVNNMDSVNLANLAIFDEALLTEVANAKAAQDSAKSDLDGAAYFWSYAQEDYRSAMASAWSTLADSLENREAPEPELRTNKWLEE